MRPFRRVLDQSVLLRGLNASVDISIISKLWIWNGSRYRRDFPSPRRSDAPRDLSTAEPRRRANRPCVDRFCRGLATGGVETFGRAEAGRFGARPPPRAGNPLPRRTTRAGTAGRLDRSIQRILARPV